jgi:signal transduction histidine kinase
MSDTGSRLIRHGGSLVLAVLIGLIAYGYILDEDPTPPDDRWLVLDLRLGIVASVALLWRRRWPVALALGVVAISLLSAAAAGAAVVLVYTVAAERRAQVAVPVAFAFILLSPAFHLARARTDLPFWDSPAFAFAIAVGAALAWGMYVRTRRQLLRSLVERAQIAEAEQQRNLVHARRLERTRIAREMHDVLAHRLSLLSMQAGALEFRSDIAPEQVTRAAGVVRESAHQALEDLRDVIGVLREDRDGGGAVRPQPVLADLPALIEESRGAGLHVREDYRLSDLAAVPTTTGRTAYRITQEGLTNARKHTAGDPADVVVDVVVDGTPAEELTIEIRN